MQYQFGNIFYHSDIFILCLIVLFFEHKESKLVKTNQISQNKQLIQIKLNIKNDTRKSKYK